MTVRELAEYLATLPEDLQGQEVAINGWGSDEGLGPFVVTGADACDCGGIRQGYVSLQHADQKAKGER